MAHRRILAAVAVLAMLATAGCIGQYGVGISEDELAEDAEYDWNTTTTTEIRLSEGGILGGAEQEVVYSGNDTVLRLSIRGFTRSHAEDIRSVRYRYAENDTVVGHESIGVSQTARQTTVRLPEAEGQFAFTGDRRSQELHLETVDDGSLEVVLPPRHRVGDILLSDVLPRAYDSDTVDGRMVLHWDDVDGGETVLVRHYRERDRYAFYALLGVLAVTAVIGYAYFSREIRKIQRRRERHGLDVDTDDDGERPPPGMG